MVIHTKGGKKKMKTSKVGKGRWTWSDHTELCFQHDVVNIFGSTENYALEQILNGHITLN